MALIAIDYQAAIDPLIRLLTITESSEVRYTAIEGLGLLNAAQAVDLIRSFAHDDNHHVQERAQTALNRLAG
jgi:HEAT repeat protein